MEELSDCGIETGVVMMPILPFIEDTSENIKKIVMAAASHGADYIIPAFGMSIREGQREHFYEKLDVHFPGLRQSDNQCLHNRCDICDPERPCYYYNQPYSMANLEFWLANQCPGVKPNPEHNSGCTHGIVHLW